ncbi:uncharacterized protein BT62DRAFT_1013342, partial [Guyanagaster necrorhizus]
RLSEVFDVELAPVILDETSEDGEWTGEVFVAYKAFVGENKEDGSLSTEERGIIEFHLSAVSDIVEIGRTEYIEYTGCDPYDPPEGNCRYFGGGMFLRAKNSQA